MCGRREQQPREHGLPSFLTPHSCQVWTPPRYHLTPAFPLSTAETLQPPGGEATLARDRRNSLLIHADCPGAAWSLGCLLRCDPRDSWAPALRLVGPCCPHGDWCPRCPQWSAEASPCSCSSYLWPRNSSFLFRSLSHPVACLGNV